MLISSDKTLSSEKNDTKIIEIGKMCYNAGLNNILSISVFPHFVFLLSYRSTVIRVATRQAQDAKVQLTLGEQVQVIFILKSFY